MTMPTETREILDEYLAEGPQVLPDRVLDAALVEIDHTPQRHGWRLPWRLNYMPTFQKFAVVGVALVAIVVFGGLSFRLAPAIGTDPSQQPGSPPATRVPDATATPVRVTLGSGADELKVRFDLPAGWHIYEDTNVTAFRPEQEDSLWPLIGVDFLLVDDVYADTCEGGALAEQAPGPTVDDLVSWLRNDSGVETGEPRPLTVAGHDGVVIEVTSAMRLECTDMAIWPSGLPTIAHRGGPYLIRPSMEYRVMALDVDGRRVVLVLNGMRGTFEGRLDEAQAVLDSVVFE